MATLAGGESRHADRHLARDVAPGSERSGRGVRRRRGGSPVFRLGRRPSGPYRRPPVEAVLRSSQGGQPVGEVESGAGPAIVGRGPHGAGRDGCRRAGEGRRQLERSSNRSTVSRCRPTLLTPSRRVRRRARRGMHTRDRCGTPRSPGSFLLDAQKRARSGSRSSRTLPHEASDPSGRQVLKAGATSAARNRPQTRDTTRPGPGRLRFFRRPWIGSARGPAGTLARRFRASRTPLQGWD